MRDCIIEALKNIKKLVNLYLTTIGFMLLLYMINLLNPSTLGKIDSIKIFNLELYSAYFSLAYGILFGVFIVVLSLQIGVLKRTIIHIKSHEKDDFNSLIESIKYYPWIVSPFHESKIGFLIFRSAIVVSFIFLGIIACSHMFGNIPQDANVIYEYKYRLIGYVDALIFIGGTVLATWLYKNICFIKRELC